MRRGFREVERNFSNQGMMKKEISGYQNIKPESDITINQARSFWDNMFKNMEARNSESERPAEIELPNSAAFIGTFVPTAESERPVEY